MNFFKLFSKKNKKHASEKEDSPDVPVEIIIPNIFSQMQFIEIGDVLSHENPSFHAKYLGLVVKAGAESMLRIYIDDDVEFEYHEGQKISALYTHNNDLYILEMQINNLQESDTHCSEAHKLKNNHRLKEHASKLLQNLESLRFIEVSGTVIKDPHKYQRRKKYRIVADWIIHFKILNPTDDLSLEQIGWMVEKIFEVRNGYFRIKTLDISEGGFKSRIHKPIPVGTEIECIIDSVSDKDAASIDIVGIVLSCIPHSDNPELFDIRVQFLNVSRDKEEFVRKNMVITENKDINIKRQR